LPGGGTTLLAEVTFRPGSPLATVPVDEVVRRVIDDLVKLRLLDDRSVVLDAEIRTFPHAYVIYDLDHRRHCDAVLGYLRDRGIDCLGRFAEFEYLNTDQVVERAMRLASRLNTPATAIPASSG
jgi:protoporphyrinogen oxidase